jgi:hypothetical protein
VSIDVKFHECFTDLVVLLLNNFWIIYKFLLHSMTMILTLVHVTSSGILFLMFYDTKEGPLKLNRGGETVLLSGIEIALADLREGKCNEHKFKLCVLMQCNLGLKWRMEAEQGRKWQEAEEDSLIQPKPSNPLPTFLPN